MEIEVFLENLMKSCFRRISFRIDHVNPPAIDLIAKTMSWFNLQHTETNIDRSFLIKSAHLDDLCIVIGVSVLNIFHNPDLREI